MTQNNQPDDGRQEPDEGHLSFLIGGADGRIIDPQSLSRSDREEIFESMKASGAPEEILAMIRQTLALDDDSDDRRNQPQDAPTADGKDDEPRSLLCCQTHMWEVLDELFPANPHLWSATEALLTVSQALDSAEDDPLAQYAADRMKQAALVQAQHHIEAELHRMGVCSEDEGPNA